MIYFQTDEFLTDADSFVRKCLPSLNVSYEDFMGCRRTNKLFACRQYMLQVMLAIYGVTRDYGEGAYISSYAKILHKKSRASIINSLIKFDNYYASDQKYQEGYRQFFKDIFPLYFEECKDVRARILYHELLIIDSHEPTSWWEKKRADLVRLYG
jgi:hypothetical protein